MSHKEQLQQYDQLIARHRGLIVKVCQIYAHRDETLAQDLYQDIALELWRQMGRLRREESEAAWLWHIAVNTAIDKLRFEQRRPQLVLVDTLPEQAAGDTSQRIDDLYEAIAHLPADDQLLVSSRLDGMDYRQIAQLTGRSEGSLSVRYARIVEQLKITLKVDSMNSTFE